MSSFRLFNDLIIPAITAAIISDFSLSTSVSLIRRVRAVEPGAWETLLKLYGPLVYACARRQGAPRDDAADLVQIVFLAVWKNLPNFSLDRLDASFRGWLRTITINAIREQLRRQKGHATVIASALSEIADSAASLSAYDDAVENPDDEMFGDLTHQALRVVRETMDARTWEAFWNSTIEEKPVAEIAAALGMTPAAVRQAKYRVLCRLRVLLADR
jgi:RNA polymerase sigma-70 factor (ECF subfamily)